MNFVIIINADSFSFSLSGIIWFFFKENYIGSIIALCLLLLAEGTEFIRGRFHFV